MEASHDDLAGMYHLENPSRTIEGALVQQFAEEQDVKDVRREESSGSWSKPEEVKRRFSSGLLLEVRTLRWGLEPSSWSQFHVYLDSGARLVSAQDAKEIWYDACKFQKVNADRDPTLDDLKAKDGELLKSMVKEAVEGCAAELWSKLRDGEPPK